MIICTRCGYANEDDAKLCVNCQAFLEWDGTRASIGADEVRPVPPGHGEPDEPPPGAPPGAPRRGVHASLSSEPVSVAPGAEAAIELQVRNTGTVVEELRIEVGGVAASFAAVEPAALSLFPGAEGSARITFRPPRDPGTPTGPLPFTVAVTSQVSPDARAFLAGVVTVGGFSELTVGLVPRTATSRRLTEHRLTIANAGNLPVEATVHASDPDAALRLKPAPAAVHLPAGGQAGARIRARPRRLRWMGEPLRHPFTVEARTRDKPPLTIDGVMIQAPILPRWTLRAALATGVAIVAVAGVLAYTSGYFTSSSETTVPPTSPPPSSGPPPQTTVGPTQTTASPTSAPESTASTVIATVPGVAGLDSAEATSRLEGAGFVVQAVERASNRIAAGSAIRTDPPEGAQPGNGAKVQLFVSTGPTQPFDLVAHASSASWASGMGQLTFNGSSTDEGGFVQVRDGVKLEDGSTPGQVLLTSAQRVPSGFIEGGFTLPAALIAGDHFSSQVGFLAPQDPSVTDEVDFNVFALGGKLGDNAQQVASIRDRLDGQLRPIDVDLSRVAGATVIVLQVQAGATAEQIPAVWVDTKVEGRAI
jgi:hypothetical protein